MAGEASRLCWASRVDQISSFPYGALLAKHFSLAGHSYQADCLHL